MVKTPPTLTSGGVLFVAEFLISEQQPRGSSRPPAPPSRSRRVQVGAAEHGDVAGQLLQRHAGRDRRQLVEGARGWADLHRGAAAASAPRIAGMISPPTISLPQ